MKKAAVKATLGVATVALAGGIYVGTVFNASHVETTTPVEAPHYVDKQAVINALSKEAELIGVTGKVKKTVEFHDNQWYGDKTYNMTAKGKFKLGIKTSEIQIETHANTVSVKFPQPKIISVELPFDKAKISKDVGKLRKGINEAELQSLYGKARTSSIEDIKRNRQAHDDAEKGVKKAIEALVGQVENVKNIEFEGAE